MNSKTRHQQQQKPLLFVIKRDGTQQKVRFDKVTERITRMCEMKPPLNSDVIDPTEVAQTVIKGIFPGVKTTQLDVLAAETAAYRSQQHPHYDKLAARLTVSNLHRETSGDFVQVQRQLLNYVNPKTQQPAPMIGEQQYAFAMRNAAKLTAAMKYNRDYRYNYFGYKTLERSYLMRCDGAIVERPQDMLMRVAIGIHYCEDAADDEQSMVDVLETYDLLSRGMFIHATPTLFNAGTRNAQMSSCFLVALEEDSIEGIYETLKKCALISKSAGGIGISVSNVRAAGSYIRGTGGDSNGLVPMLRVYNDTARYVDQGGGKRKGAFAIYLEPWHGDIFEFLELKKNHGSEESRARDLFYGLWIPDLFMRRVEADGNWSLFCPSVAKGLNETHGSEFERLYEQYERQGKAIRTIKAQTLWRAIVESQIETGTPYMLYKDACNAKSNQQNLGTIKSSNLCVEIVEYTARDEIAVCNLASLALPKYVSAAKFDHQLLAGVVRTVTRNLNKIIDRNHYPVAEARKSNMRHRPIGLGVQGLADVFIMLRMPFDSPAARQLNREIFETIYYAALDASCTLAEQVGAPYSSYAGSPASKGRLQFDLWAEKPESDRPGSTKRWNWRLLKKRIAKFGVRNSLLVAPMPTASTSQILGNNECIEPYTSNIYVRRVLAGEFTVVNAHLVADLEALGMWTDEVRNEIVRGRGSVQALAIPSDLKKLYRTVWEIKQRALIDMAADRGIYVDQSQSFNVHLRKPTFAKLTSMHFYGWKKGLKSGMYYLRSQAATDAIQFTVSDNKKKKNKKKVTTTTNKKESGDEASNQADICTMQDGCFSCGS